MHINDNVKSFLNGLKRKAKCMSYLKDLHVKSFLNGLKPFSFRVVDLEREVKSFLNGLKLFIDSIGCASDLM